MKNQRVESADDSLDRYYTPEWAIRALLEHIDGVYGMTVSEPCAGRGDIEKAMNEAGADVCASDIAPQKNDHLQGDATLPVHVPGGLPEAHLNSDIVITNPPYSADSGSASEVITNLINELDKPVWALLWLSGLEPTDSRYPLIESLSRLIILPRVHFTGPAINKNSGGPGSCSAWFGWIPGEMDQPATVEVVSKRQKERLKGQSSLLSE
jgi:hypothetical protein